ncbi:MAG: ribose transport system permease protein, partial [Pseudonocardiales bacterium]|nr:ribose transport system permease protein [Pseudonocardiales bacterium]
MTLTDIASAGGGGGSAAVEDAPAGRLQRIARVQALQIVLLLAITVAVFAILRPNTFLTPFNIRGMVQNTSIYIVLGVGMTFVIITGGIDLSIGSVLVFSGVVADKVMASYGGQGWDTVLVGTVVACASGLAWGLLNGVLVAKAKVPPLIVTLGSLSAALG